MAENIRHFRRILSQKGDSERIQSLAKKRHLAVKHALSSNRNLERQLLARSQITGRLTGKLNARLRRKLR